MGLIICITETSCKQIPNSCQNSILALLYTCRIRRKSIYNWQISQSNLCHLLKSVIPSLLSSDQQFKSLYLHNLSLWLQHRVLNLFKKQKSSCYNICNFRSPFQSSGRTSDAPTRRHLCKQMLELALKRAVSTVPLYFHHNFFSCVWNPLLLGFHLNNYNIIFTTK